MSKEQEYVFVELRATFNLPVDDKGNVWQFIHLYVGGI